MTLLPADIEAAAALAQDEARSLAEVTLDVEETKYEFYASRCPSKTLV